MPLLWRRLNSEGIESPGMANLRGVYRRSWYRNNLVLAEVSSIAAILAREGIDVLVLKGGAVALLYYDDHASRPMNDVDILVRPWQARQSAAALLAEGWTYKVVALREAGFDWRSRVELRNPGGNVVDLHWDFLSDYVVPGVIRPAVDTAWATSRTHSSMPDQHGRTQPVRVLSPEAQLLHTVLHGARWDPEARLQWVADATLILRSSESAFDWDGLVALAISAGRGHVLGDALSYLRAGGFARVPAGVPVALRGSARRRPASDWLRGRSFPRAVGGTPLLAAAYLDLRRQRPDTRRLPPLGPFLRAAWNLENHQSIAAFVPSKVATMVRKAIRGG